MPSPDGWRISSLDHGASDNYTLRAGFLLEALNLERCLDGVAVQPEHIDQLDGPVSDRIELLRPDLAECRVAGVSSPPLCQDQVRHQGQQLLVELEG